MRRRLTAAALAAVFACGQPALALAQGGAPGGYTLLTPQQASSLPNRGGALGMDIQHGQTITSNGLTFELMRVNGVRVGTPGAQAGFHTGDQIVAADGHVFPNTSAFAAYVRSLAPGTLMSVDYLPPNGGPQQAQRVGVTVGDGGHAVAPAQASAPGGLSTGTKLAIGAAAVALFGCYEMGCFNKRPTPQQQ